MKGILERERERERERRGGGGGGKGFSGFLAFFLVTRFSSMESFQPSLFKIKRSL
jgi:hypothetical protein